MPRNASDRSRHDLHIARTLELKGGWGPGHDADPDNAHDVSACAVVGDLLLLGSDESRELVVFDWSRGADTATFRRRIRLLDGDDELDIEAMDTHGRDVYVLCSHCRVRPKMDDDDPVAENRKRFAGIDKEKNRRHLFRVRLDPADPEADACVQDYRKVRHLLRKEKLIEPFLKLPSKENGVDLEGLAALDDLLWLGFRGPVFRQNFVPVLRMRFEKPRRPELRLVQLDGSGIREMCPVSDGLLLLSGPINDSVAQPRNLWWWDGRDMSLGADADPGRVRLLGEVPRPDDAQPEGLSLLAETRESYTVLVVYDGVPGGGPALLEVPRPALD